MSTLISQGVGGLPRYAGRLLSALGSVNSTLVRTGGTDLHQIIGYNARASFVYMKLYNKATAPTVGTDDPLITLTIPATGAFALHFPPLHFNLGLGFGFTTAIADNSTAALTAADITGLNLIYA